MNENEEHAKSQRIEGLSKQIANAAGLIWYDGRWMPQLAAALECLGDIRDHFNENLDVSWDGGPSHEMRLVTLIDMVLDPGKRP